MSDERNEKILQSELMQIMQRMKKIRLNILYEQVIYSEYYALEQIDRYVKEHPGSIGIYVSELAESMKIVPSSASRLLNTMEGKGLITRKVDTGSRRNIFVCLTPAGRDILTSTARDMDLLKSQIIRRMGPEDISRLIGLWGKLADIMEDEMHQLLERRKKRTEERP